MVICPSTHASVPSYGWRYILTVRARHSNNVAGIAGVAQVVIHDVTHAVTQGLNHGVLARCGRVRYNRLMKEIFVAHEHEISDGGRRIVIDDDNVEIGVFRVDGAFYAWRNDCPHQGGPVCQGKLMQGTEERLDAERRSLGIHYCADSLNIVCPWHGFEFDVRTGRHFGHAKMRLASYPVTVRDGQIYVVAK
jgi:nitrite reductase/ring-hydroxylating ferredoxin subunit